MSHTVMLTLRYLSSLSNLTNCCINLRFEKERYTPYSELHGQWYCPAGTNISEIVSVILYIDGAVRHYGYPTDIKFVRKDGRLVLDVSSISYTAALAANQCPDGLLTDINLAGLAAAGASVPLVAFQQDTPTVNYVSYYDGTSSWDAIVCYSIRATGNYPYIYGYNTVRINAPENKGTYSTTSDKLISRGNATDYKRIISSIVEKDIDGTPNAFAATNGAASQRTISRNKEISFDREWRMDPAKGLQFKIDYSMRAFYCDIFSFPDYGNIDLLDSFAVTDLGFAGEVDRLIVTASAEKGFVTTVWCYHDAFCT